MNKTIIVISILIVIVIFLAVAAVYLKPFDSGTVKKNLTVGNQTFEVGIADNMVNRTQGLSGRSYLDEKEGLLFLFSFPRNSGFWMKGMKFAIDIVWINDGEVIGFSENLQPQPGKSIFSLPIYYPPDSVDQVLEINAGAVSKYNLKIGDIVSLE